MKIADLNVVQRLYLLVTSVLIGATGYWLRFLAPIPPEWRDHTGGISYVVFWIFVLAIFCPRMKAWRIALTILAITCALEFAQLWHPLWLERVRRTFPGRVILGTTFDWYDFPPYFVGALLGWALLGAFTKLAAESRRLWHKHLPEMRKFSGRRCS